MLYIFRRVFRRLTFHQLVFPSPRLPAIISIDLPAAIPVGINPMGASVSEVIDWLNKPRIDLSPASFFVEDFINEEAFLRGHATGVKHELSPFFRHFCNPYLLQRKRKVWLIGYFNGRVSVSWQAILKRTTEWYAARPRWWGAGR